MKLREEPLPMLVMEAGWRAIRSARQSIFPMTTGGTDCRFRPLGYYGLPTESPQDAASVVSYADAILRGEFPLMGYGSPQLGRRPDWQCDWVSGKRWPIENAKNLRIVRHDGSDVKAPWELSRLQWSPVVAHAYLLSGEKKYRSGLQSLLSNWIAENPPGLGVNWTVAMEAALRGISLCLTMERLWPFTEEEQPWLQEITASLWQHLRFIEMHNEYSFLLRSNHYLSNIVGLTTLSSYLGLERRREKYARVVQREVLLQTYADGGDCEASTGYHFLVAQLALHSFLVQQRSNVVMTPDFQSRLGLMISWMATLSDEAWKLPHLGDCDNGRVELTADDIAQAALPADQGHSLRIGAFCKWGEALLHPFSGRPSASLLAESGVAVLRSGEASAIFCAMPNGLRGKGSHTHCDKLAIIFRLGPHEVFCDVGSRYYTRSAERRNQDRSTRAHNTLMVDGEEQNSFSADPRVLFQCGNEAIVSPIVQSGDAVCASHQGYARIGVEHQRTVKLQERLMLVIDEVTGKQNHTLDLRFVLGPEWRVTPGETTGHTVTCTIEGPRRLTLQCEATHALALSIIPTEISREYGSGLPASCIHIHATAPLPVTLQTRVQWD